MKNIKLDDMPIKISYGKNKIDKDILYTIFTNIIKRIERNEGVKNEKENCSTN
ncbi:hypothetical protein [Romboutsia sp.]|uniref:hypothetical protein n=1 Tax=Romboutsia sp. TaxID=1965302 RepID=UPI002B8B3497|nr:hypothetical protein [Romboutsia sp.]HSQ88907.1 hypothetical protein [Romboutsia sp.]